jgi:RNA recognition motif-containing protein
VELLTVANINGRRLLEIIMDRPPKLPCFESKLRAVEEDPLVIQECAMDGKRTNTIPSDADLILYVLCGSKSNVLNAAAVACRLAMSCPRNHRRNEKSVVMAREFFSCHNKCVVEVGDSYARLLNPVPSPTDVSSSFTVRDTHYKWLLSFTNQKKTLACREQTAASVERSMALPQGGGLLCRRATVTAAASSWNTASLSSLVRRRPAAFRRRGGDQNDGDRMVISKRSFGTTTTLRRQARGGNNNNSSSCSLAQSFFLAGGGGDDDDQGGGSKHKAYYYHSSGTRNGISCRPTATRRYSKLTRRQDDNDSDDDGDGSPGNNNSTSPPAEAFQFQEVRVHPVSPFGIDWLTRVWTPPSRNADHPAVVAAAAALELNVLQWKNSSATLEPLPLTSDDSLRQHYQHHQHHHRETTVVAVAAKASETASETTTTMEMTSSSQSSPLGGFGLVDWDAQRTTEKAIGVVAEPATVLDDAAVLLAPTIQQQQLVVGGGEMMKMGSTTKFANKPQASGNIVWNEIYEDEEALYGGEEEQVHVEEARLLVETTAKAEDIETGTSKETSGKEAEDGTTAVMNVSVSLPDRNGTRVYVNHLSWKVVCQDLHDHMQSTGLEVKNASVLRDDVGRTKRAGIVTFHNAMDAQKAVEQLNKTELRGRKIMVREYYEDREALHANRDPALTRASLVMGDGAATKSLDIAAAISNNDNNSFAASDNDNVNNRNDDVGLLSDKAESAAAAAVNAKEESLSATDLLPVAIPESDRVFVASAFNMRPEAKDNNDKTTAATVDNNNDTKATNAAKAIPWWASRKKLLAAEQNKAL